MTNSSNTEFAIEIDVQAVKQLMDDDQSFLLLDCREPSEHEHCRIEGAQLISMGEIPERLSSMEKWRDGRIVVHCHHGIRSLRVVNWLRDQGFSGAQSMAGGIDRWSLEIDPSVPRYQKMT